MTSVAACAAITRRDLLLAARRRVEALLPLGFFIVAAGLFPIGVGPEPQMLRTIAPGVVWVCALLAAMLSVTQMFASDYQDGTLEQLLLAPQSLTALVVGKVFAQWLSSGVPLVVAARKEMETSMARATGPRVLQATAKAKSARVKTAPPWATSTPFMWAGPSVMRATARPGPQSTSRMPAPAAKRSRRKSCRCSSRIPNSQPFS